MSIKKSIEIHETAFVTSAYRASYESISKDYYAKLWRNPKTTAWIKNYSKSVSSEEAFTHSLRNRYFLEKIKESVQNNKIDLLINFGSGFSMYPYFLNENLTHIEIDKPDIIAYKKDRISDFLADYKLPKREVHYISSDFSKDYEMPLLYEINKIKANRSSFILIEGVLFFLNRKETLRLFDLFSKIQKKNDLVGSVSFQDQMEETETFKKLIKFFKEQVVLSDHFEYQTINDGFYNGLKNYTLVDQQDYFSIKAKYAPEKSFTEEILNENLYILTKN